MDKRLFYPRLAASNLRKNHSIYRPYLLAVVLLSAMYYCLASLARIAARSGMSGGGSLGAILGMGTWLMGVLSLLVLFYANSFLIRRRRREFGLYSVLGMEKRHICLVLMWEVLLVAVGGVVLGMAAGALFSQLFLLLLQRLTRLPVQLELWIPLEAVGDTAALFAAAFALVLVYDAAAVLRSRPLELLRSDRQGEREPKARWLLALLGVVTLGGGYVMALMPSTAADALIAFLPAALLVMVGTYCLFTAGSIAVLKLMKRSRNFYYRAKNFLSVSTLLYRMKQNAAGLAAICILSTCVLVTLSTTVSLFLGQQDMLRREFPRMVNVDARSAADGDLAALEAGVAAAAAEYGVTVSNAVGLRVFDGAVTAQGGGVYRSVPWFGSETRELLAVTVDDYNRCAGTDLTLEDGQVYVCDENAGVAAGALQLDGWTYAIAGQLYGGYYILKAPHHGTASHWSHLFSEISAEHILISSGGYDKGGKIAQEYVDFPAVKHCTNCEPCEWYAGSGCSCSRMAVCYDLAAGPGLTIKCPFVRGGQKEESDCRIYVVGASGRRSCLCDNLPSQINL